MRLSAGPSEEAALLYERRGGVAWLSFNRPETKNAINQSMMLQMLDILASLQFDQEIRAVVMRGLGPNFSAGGDLSTGAEIIALDAKERSERARREVTVPAELGRALFSLRQPLIVSARGHTIGQAFMLALAADLVVASENARFSFPYVRLAQTMDHGESFYLLRKVGWGSAMQLMLLGAAIDADEARKMNLVNWVVPDDELDERTEQLASRLSALPPLAVQRTKEMLRGAPGRVLDEQLEVEADSIAITAATDDFGEAIRAFFEKRKPVFTGR